MVGRLVALQLPPEGFPAELHAAWAAEDAVLPLPLDAPDPTVDDLLARLRPDELIRAGAERDVEHVALAPQRPVPDDTALVVATSGSTGVPKGVVLSHRALDASTAASVRRLGAQPGDRFTLALPLHHVAGLQVVLRAWRCGTEPTIVSDPGDLHELTAVATGHVSLVPTQLRRLVEGIAAGDLPQDAVSRWRTILVGGAHLDADLHARATAAGATIVTSYGMTETCGGCVYDGLPLDDVEVALAEDGRVRIRGPVLFSGYLRQDPGGDRDRDEAVDGEGWFTTGDLGVLRDGRLEVLGRHDDIIISGGENVPAGLVAAVLLTHPAVADVAVVGVADPEWGQRTVAVLVPTDPSAPPSLRALREHVAATRPASHAPRQVVVTDRIPRDGLGKPTRSALLRLATETPPPSPPHTP